jgi:hypothetical protein
VNVAVQLAVPTVVPTWARVHGVVVPNEEPVALPVIANATVPAGVETVPALVAGSTTVAVQVEVALMITDDGLHETVAVVGRKLTVTDAAVALELVA